MITLPFNAFSQAASTDSLTTKLVEMGGRRILYGQTQPAQIFFDFPVWKTIYEAAPLDTAAIQKLTGAEKAGLEVLIFLGTWCGDSRREVPRFIKTLEKSGFAPGAARYYAVDPSKKMDGPLIEQYSIRRVPTFVVLRDGREIGRITEYPDASVEADLAAILFPSKK